MISSKASRFESVHMRQNWSFSDVKWCLSRHFLPQVHPRSISRYLVNDKQSKGPKFKVSAACFISNSLNFNFPLWLSMDEELC